MTNPQDSNHKTLPSVRESAALTARLRELSALGRDADPAERAAFLADKDALIARITDPAATGGGGREGVRAEYAAREALEQLAIARAVEPGYVLVGPSARTWLRDPATGRPAAEVSEAEHHAVRALMGREALDTTEPHWITDQDGHADIQTPVVASTYPDDTADSGSIHDLDATGQLLGESGHGLVEEAFTRAEAAERLTERGFDPVSAQAMVAGYLHDTSRAVGAPVYLWGLDQTDVAAIADEYRWVDHQGGETLAEARERAADYAAGWAERAAAFDGDSAPGYAWHAEQQAAQWAERASVPEPFIHTDATDAAEDSGELAERINALHDRVADLEPDHESRREQLAHWHHDDHEPADDEADSADNGQLWVGDDGSGLP